MPHIEEGELHALLDGAYAHDGPAAARIREEIASCADCRARFDEAQALRMRASAILDRAQPGTTSPPFDAVLQRAEIVDAPRRFRFPGLARLAWAATIVLALGIGWFGRDQLYSRKQSTSAELARPKNEPAAQPVAQTAAAPAGPTPPPVPQRANTTAPQPPAAPPSERVGAGAANTRRLAATEANAREERADKFAERKEADAGEKAKLRDESQRTQNQVTQSAAASDSTLRQRFAQSAQKAAPQATPAAAPKPEALLGRAALALSDSVWQYVTLEEAERTTGRRILRIPGVAVVNVGVSGSAGSYVTRATMRLPDGAMIEIVQRPTAKQETSQLAGGRAAEAAAEAAPPSTKDATGATVLTLTRNGWVLTGRGTLSVDSLRVLLNNAR